MNHVPHQWVLDRLSALGFMGEMDKEEVKRIHALFVQRFPDEVATMNEELQARRRYMQDLARGLSSPFIPIPSDLEQQGDNYITESARE